MNTKKSLHTQLKHFRELKGLSPTEVANQLGLTRQAIYNWEAGRSYPDLDNIVLLCKLYDVSVDELLGVSTKKTLSKEESQAMCQTTAESANSVAVNPLTEEHMQTKILEKNSSSILEMLCLAVILVLSCQFTIIGIVTPILVAIWMKKNSRPYKIIYILCIVCFIVSLSNGYIRLENILNFGTSTIEPV